MPPPYIPHPRPLFFFAWISSARLVFPETNLAEKGNYCQKKETTLKMISVFLGRVLYFTMNWMHYACSTFITAKITVLHQQIYPKRYCETRSLLFNPHTSLSSWNISITLLIALYLDQLCKHTFLTHVVILKSLMAHVLKTRGLRIKEAGYCTPSDRSVPTSCCFMKQCCSATFWLRDRLTVPCPALWIHARIKTCTSSPPSLSLSRSCRRSSPKIVHTV